MKQKSTFLKNIRNSSEKTSEKQATKSNKWNKRKKVIVFIFRLFLFIFRLIRYYDNLLEFFRKGNEE